MEVGVSCSRPKAALVGDVDEHDAVIRETTPDAAQNIGGIIQMLQDGCQQHDVVLLLSVEAPSFLDRGDLHRELGVGRGEGRGHLYSCHVPPLVPRPEQELASAAPELEQASFASQENARFARELTA
jgi:hypothetical protein